MTENDAYELDSPSVVSEKFLEGSVILNLNTGEYFEVSEKAIPAFELVTSGKSVSSISSLLKNGGAAQSEGFDQFVKQLVEFQLLRLRSQSGIVGTAEDIQTLKATDGGFLISRHSDLTELLAADPVHDVDHETGELKAQ